MYCGEHIGRDRGHGAQTRRRVGGEGDRRRQQRDRVARYEHCCATALNRRPAPAVYRYARADRAGGRFRPPADGFEIEHLPFTTRMTLVRLRDGALWVHSPIALTPRLRLEVEALGPVRYLIAPNTFHYAFLIAWLTAYPDALSYGAPGVSKRARDNGVALYLDRTLGAAADPAWAEEIEQLLVMGSVMNEAVFLHRPSRTLILTDLIENFEPHRVRNPVYRLSFGSRGRWTPMARRRETCS